MREKVLHRLNHMTTLVVVPIAIFVMACFSFVQTDVNAATTVPTTMNFQGRLLDASGMPVADGLYNMKFALYDQASGGTLKWSETRETTTRVQVTGGLFSTKLGEASSLSATIFASGALYFEITLPSPATATCSTAACASWEPPMAGRHLLSASAYAYNAETLDGIDGAAFAQLSANNTFSGATTINTASSSALAVVNGANNLFKVDTTNSQIVVGQSDTTGAVLVLDTKTDAGDPTGGSAVAGAMYYNASSGKFRCYQSAAWTDCITAPGGGATLQTAYDASGTPATITTTASKGVKIAAGAVPTTNLFMIDNTGQAVATNDANGLAVNYVGGAGVIEAAGMRVDYAPGGTSGSTWSGLRVVANPTGPVSGVTAYGIKLEGPSSPGAGTEIGLRVASGFDIGMDIASGGLQLSAMNDPATPAAGNLRVYAKTNAGRTMLKVKGPSGVDYSLQPFLGTNKIGYYSPNGNATTLTSLGITATATGTATARNVAVTNLFQSTRRLGYVSAGTAGSLSGVRSAALQFYRGDAAGRGGFYYIVRFGLSTANVANQRTFVGLNTVTAAPTNVNPSTLVNSIGFACDATDTNFVFMHNDGTGTATRVALTGTFPCNTNTTDLYEARIYSEPNGTAVYYSLARLNTTDFFESSASTDLPANTQLLGSQIWTTNNATGAAVGIDVVSLYVETDN